MHGWLRGCRGLCTSTLRQVTSSLNDLFLLVIVGGVQHGQIRLAINALLRSNVLEEGREIPQLTRLRSYVTANRTNVVCAIMVSWEIENPANFLRDISIVLDTPGVNAGEHEQ